MYFVNLSNTLEYTHPPTAFVCRIEMFVVLVDPFVSAMHMDRRDDDFLDRLNHKVTTSVLFFLAFMHTFYQVCPCCVTSTTT